MLTYLIGDIHGRATALGTLLRAIDDDLATRGGPHQLMFLGDLVDRGPQCAEVLDMAHGRGDAVILKGNHDVAMAHAILGGDRDIRRFWVEPNMGGWITLADVALAHDIEHDIDDGLFAGDAELDLLCAAVREALDDSVVGWLEDERPGAYYRFVGNRFLAVHAGVDPSSPVAAQDKDTLTWIREPFLLHPGPYHDCRMVIHGHTPQPGKWPDTHNHRINLDLGSYFTGDVAAALVDDDHVIAFFVADAGSCRQLADPLTNRH